jgi:hypothetical protein
VAPKGDVSRTLPVAVDWWKAVFKETKRTLVRGRPWRYGGEEGEGSNSSVVLVSLSRRGVVLAAVPSALFHLNGFPRRDDQRGLQSAARSLTA